MDYNNTTTLSELIYERQQLGYRILMLVLGSLLSLMVVFNLLRTNPDSSIVQPTQIFSELANSFQNGADSDTQAPPGTITEPIIPMAVQDTTQTATTQAVPTTEAQIEAQPTPALQHEPVARPTDASPEWVKTIVRRGDSVASILTKQHVAAGQAVQLLSSPVAYLYLHQLKTDSSVQLLVNKGGQLLEFKYPIDHEQTLLIRRIGQGYETEVEVHGLDEKLHAKQFTVHGTLRASLHNAGLGAKQLVELSNIFSAQLNFSRDIRPGTEVALLYQSYYRNGKLVNNGPILAAKVSSKGHVYEAFRYKDRMGNTAYYNANGQSLEPGFIRTPVHYRRIASPFNLHRFHPILRIVRPHYGVDLSANRGTPVVAAGNGQIMFRGRRGGFGNVILINHFNGYQTIYGHLQRFASGIHNGSHVTRGQLIGYVGMTGLAEGPHLHYEVHVNNRPVDPLHVRLPLGPGIDGYDRAAFKAFAERAVSRM